MMMAPPSPPRLLVQEKILFQRTQLNSARVKGNSLTKRLLTFFADIDSRGRSCLVVCFL